MYVAASKRKRKEKRFQPATVSINACIVLPFFLFFSDDRVQPNRYIRQRWPVVYFRLIANFLNASAITIRTLTFGAVKIWNCHSNRGCAVEHWKLCHARMLDIYLESVLRTRYVTITINSVVPHIIVAYARAFLVWMLRCQRNH